MKMTSLKAHIGGMASMDRPIKVCCGLQGILCNLTLIPQTAPRDETAALGQLRLAAALGIQFVDISNLPLRINALTLRHIFVNPRTLLSHVTRHLTLQVQSPASISIA